MEKLEALKQKTLAIINNRFNYLENLAEKEEYARLIIEASHITIHELFDTSNSWVTPLYELLLNLNNSFTDDGDYCLVREINQPATQLRDRFKSKLLEMGKPDLAEKIDNKKPAYIYDLRHGDWVAKSFNKSYIKAVSLTKESLVNILKLAIEKKKEEHNLSSLKVNTDEYDLQVKLIDSKKDELNKYFEKLLSK